jgi:cell division protein FtsL
VRSATLVNTGARLISLQQQEAQLIMKNNELKIEVEKLKEPERITTIAEKQLGMSVARNNIYVKAKTN